MNPRHLAILAAASVLSAAALAGAPQPVATIGVFAEHYVLGSSSYDDLNRLEGALRGQRAHAVRLDVCGPGAEHALRAAAHRFRDLYLELRTAGTDPQVCSTTVARAVTVGQVAGQRPYGIDHAAVDLWWHHLMP